MKYNYSWNINKNRGRSNRNSNNSNINNSCVWNNIRTFSSNNNYWCNY